MAEPLPKKRFMGRQAKAKAASSQDRDESDVDNAKDEVGFGLLQQSDLVVDGLKKWSKGLLHSTEVHQICFHAYQDQVKLLKSLGVNPNKAN